MKKLLLIWMFIVGFNIYSQDSSYKPILDSDIKMKYERVIDTVNNEPLTSRWTKLRPIDRQIIRDRISQMKKDIEFDTSDITQIYYFGKKEDIEFKIDGKTIMLTSPVAEYDSESIVGDSIFKISLGSIPRFSNVKKAELVLSDLKRTVTFDIDTKYSLIYIEADKVRSTVDILNDKNEMVAEAQESDKDAVLPSAQLMKKEEIAIWHKIPRSSW